MSIVLHQVGDVHVLTDRSLDLRADNTFDTRRLDTLAERVGDLLFESSDALNPRGGTDERMSSVQDFVSELQQRIGSQLPMDILKLSLIHI